MSEQDDYWPDPDAVLVGDGWWDFMTDEYRGAFGSVIAVIPVNAVSTIEEDS